MIKLTYGVVYDQEEGSDLEGIDFYTELDAAKRGAELINDNLHPVIVELTGKRWKIERNWKEY